MLTALLKKLSNYDLLSVVELSGHYPIWHSSNFFSTIQHNLLFNNIASMQYM